MKKAGNIIVGILIVLGAVVLREVIATGGMLAYVVWFAVKNQINNFGQIQVVLEELISNWELILLLSALGTLVWIGLFGFLYKKERRKDRISLFMGRLNGKRVAMLVLLGFGLQFFMNSVLGGIMKAAPDLLKNYIELIEKLGMGNSPISLVYIILIAPIGEELVFRGVVFDYLKKHISFIAVNIFQAFFFGLYHMNVVQGIYAFALGMLLGWICNKYGSIRESILLHMAVNLSGCLVSVFLPDAAVETTVGLLLLFGVGICLIAFSVNAVKIEKVKSKTGEEDDIS